MNRSVAVVLGSALAVGVALGAVAFSGSRTSSAVAGQTASDLHVVWSGGIAKRVHLESGSLQGDPGHGFVLVEVPGEKPAFYSGVAGTGPFQLASEPGPKSYEWTFRAADGSLLLVSPGVAAIHSPTLFTFLGKRLDPAKLGQIGAKGVAVPVGWGPYTRGGYTQQNRVVVLIEHSDYPAWKVDGYLPGFSLPQGFPFQQALQRPLLGKDGHLYSIDVKRQRLVRLSATGSSTPKYPHWGCTLWPARDGGSYTACPNSIVLHKGDGSSVTVLQRSLPDTHFRGWYFVQSSPDRKWLLLEDAFGACGVATWAEFQRIGGGDPVAAFPDAVSSQALGWLPDNTALVAAQTRECAGAPAGGIYEVTPGTWVEAPQLIFAGDIQDATTWGFGR